MRLLCTLPNTDDPEQTATMARLLLGGMVDLNRYLLRESRPRLPTLQESEVIFQPEPVARNLQWDEVPDVVTIVKQGFADVPPLRAGQWPRCATPVTLEPD